MAMQQVESERASVVHVIAEYNRITALQKSDTAGPLCTDDSTQTTTSTKQTEHGVEDEANAGTQESNRDVSNGSGEVAPAAAAEVDCENDITGACETEQATGADTGAEAAT